MKTTTLTITLLVTSFVLMGCSGSDVLNAKLRGHKRGVNEINASCPHSLPPPNDYEFLGVPGETEASIKAYREAYLEACNNRHKKKVGL